MHAAARGTVENIDAITAWFGESESFFGHQHFDCAVHLSADLINVSFTAAIIRDPVNQEHR